MPLVGAWLLHQWQATIGPPGALADYVHDFLSDVSFETGRALLEVVGHRAMALFFCVVVLFFMYLDGARFAAQIETVLARQFGPSGVTTMRLATQAIRGTVNGLILVGLGLAILMSLVYAFAACAIRRCGASRPGCSGSCRSVPGWRWQASWSTCSRSTRAAPRSRCSDRRDHDLHHRSLHPSAIHHRRIAAAAGAGTPRHRRRARPSASSASSSARRCWQ